MITLAMTAEQRHTLFIMTCWIIFLFAALQIAILIAMDAYFSRVGMLKGDRTFYCLGQCVVTIVLIVAAFMLGCIR